MALLRIENPYDSHVHWQATGEFAERMDLSSLEKPNDILEMTRPNGSNWILGKGWDFQSAELGGCTRSLLDQWCADVPVAFSRADGHAVWANTKAYLLSGWSEEELPQGVVTELDRNRVLNAIPKPTPSSITRHLMIAQRIFHEAGITHIRDVHMKESQWVAAKHLEESGLLKLCVESFIFDEKLNFREQIELALKMRSEVGPQSLIRIKGIKVFLDGSLGSETAALSQNYLSGSGKGVLHFSQTELEEIISSAWSKDLEVAVHCIGDEAAHRTALAALESKKKGVDGKIHFEHVQILRPDTISVMASLNSECHMQPGHWLDDKAWLKEKISEDLYKNIFPWRKLQEAQIPFYFGSDSPISQTGIFRIHQAIEDSIAAGVPKLLGGFESYVSHPDRSWPTNTFSEFEDGHVKEIFFQSESL